MRQETIRFVIWSRLEPYLLLGWLPVGHDNYHDQFGCICVWRCACKCVEPAKAHNLSIPADLSIPTFLRRAA
jgi:hypothetical protein